MFRPDDDAGLSVMVEVSPPAEWSAQRLRTVNYQRPVAHSKHVGTFAQNFHGLAARREGCDDALLTSTEGVISENTIANIGFLADDHIVWPAAPALRGITMQILDIRLAELGIPYGGHG